MKTLNLTLMVIGSTVQILTNKGNSSLAVNGLKTVTTLTYYLIKGQDL